MRGTVLVLRRGVRRRPTGICQCLECCIQCKYYGTLICRDLPAVPSQWPLLKVPLPLNLILLQRHRATLRTLAIETPATKHLPTFLHRPIGHRNIRDGNLLGLLDIPLRSHCHDTWTTMQVSVPGSIRLAGVVHPAERQEETVPQLRRPPVPPGRRAFVQRGSIGVEYAQGVLEPQRFPPRELGAVRMRTMLVEDLAEAPHGRRRYRRPLSSKVEYLPLELWREAEDLRNEAQQVSCVMLRTQWSVQGRASQDGLFLQNLGASWYEFCSEQAHPLAGTACQLVHGAFAFALLVDN